MDLLNLGDFEACAKQCLPKDIWGFIAGWAQDGLTTNRNREALKDIQLRPHFFHDVKHRDLHATLLGNHASFPVMIAPAGGQILVHPEGEKATAAAAGRSGTIMVVPTSSAYSIEEVADVATGPIWFQLYHCSRELSTMLVKRAETANYSAIVLTVDTPLPSPKEIDLRNKFDRPEGGRLGNLQHLDMKAYLNADTEGSDFWKHPPTLPLTMGDIRWLRSATSLPLVIKGIRTAHDARLCVAEGVDGIIVSNHGGRHIDSTLSSIETLPAIVDAVGSRAEIYMDSGIRRGSDVLKALALGAKAVLIGRPLFWGLAVDGQSGVYQVLEILRKELDLTMGYCGVTHVDQVDETIINVPPHFIPPAQHYISEIRALAELYKDKIITRAEFRAKKRDILGL